MLEKVGESLNEQPQTTYDGEQALLMPFVPERSKDKKKKAQKKNHWGPKFCHMIVWSNKAMFNVFGSDGKQ